MILTIRPCDTSRVRVLNVLLSCVLAAACGDSSRVITPTAPTPPAPITSVTNYTGDWGGLYTITSCTDLPPTLSYCRFNYNATPEGIRLTLNQVGTMISGSLVFRDRAGPVTGRVDDLGRLRLEGNLGGLISRVPVFEITDWRTVIDPSSGAMLGAFKVRHRWTSPNVPSAESVNEIPGILPCTKRPTELFWQCN